MLGFNALQPDGELAYHLHPGEWGRGYATEACQVVLAWFLGEYPDASVFAFVERANAASLVLAERLGFVRSKVVRNGEIQLVRDPR